MIPDIIELNFPEYATLSQATVTHNDMGERVITTQVKIDGDIKPNFSYNWEIKFKNEKYIHTLRSPQALKDNTSICSKIDMTFHHWVIYELKRHYFIELTSIKAGTAIPDKYIASLGLNVVDFVDAFQNVLNYYYNGAIKIQLNPDVEYSQERAFMNISYSYIWDVLQEFYNVYGIRWYIEGDTIYVGYPVDNISHIFEYGYESGLISIERQVQDDNIRNILLGRGGSTNLPKYYFKNAPEGSLYASDPDAIPELEYVFFSELRDKTFRDYVQGWKTNPNRDTMGGTIAVEPYDAQRGETDFAYRKGHEDENFDPIEYVKDDDSISKYGELLGGLDNNEEIYPSIQNISLEGIGLVNEIVAVEPIVSDNIDQAVDNEAIMSTTPNIVQTVTLAPQTASVIHLEHNFTVEEGLTGSLFFDTALKANQVGVEIPVGEKQPGVPLWLEIIRDISISIYNATTATHHNNGLNLPSGNYRMTVECEVFNPYPQTEGVDAKINGPANATLAVNNIKLVQSRFTDTGEEWKPTFDIWVKNIWQTEKLDTETEQEYADRVWLPIFGVEGREAMITFTSGWLSSSEGWEFVIVKGGYAYDTTKSYNGVPSHWRLTLQKSDAELKATDKYIPNMGMQAKEGDTFFFTGIDMQHQYVLFAEERINRWKRDGLNKTKNINPTYVAKLDKVRINKLENNEETLLVDSIKAGVLVTIKDKRFIEGVPTLYIQSVTYNYTDSLVADVDIVLSDKILPVLNPVQKIQGEIDSLSVKIANQSTALLNMVRQMCDALYLRKDGVEDISKSPTAFKSIVKSDNFRSGTVGGSGWGVFRDADGNSIAEFDQIRARQSFITNEFIRNTTKYQGGTQIYSAAELEISRVVENENDYECYFDQKNGSVANLFAVNDVAYSQLFNAQNNTIKIYKRRVIEVGLDFIRLSKTDQYGEGIPAEKDIVIHYGNYTDKSRQYIIVRDIIGGGYDRMISNLDGVTAKGKEYYFAGRMNGENPRWFVGDTEGDYASWRDGKMRIKGDFIISNTDTSVETMFAVQEGKIKSLVGQTQTLAAQGGFLRNSSFAEGLKYWQTNNQATTVLSLGKPVFTNGEMLVDGITDNVRGKYDEEKFFVTLKNGFIKQLNDYFVNKPTFEDFEGKEIPVNVSFKIRVKTQGTLTVKVGDNIIIDETRDTTEIFREVKGAGKWVGNEHFTLNFSGEADLTDLSLYTDELAVKTATLIEQTDKLVTITAKNFDDNGDVKTGSGIMVKPNEAGLYAQGEDGNQTKIATYADGKIVLEGETIQLKGNLTSDGNFKVREDGSIEAKNGLFNGFLQQGTIYINNDNYNPTEEVFETDYRKRIEKTIDLSNQAPIVVLEHSAAGEDKDGNMVYYYANLPMLTLNYIPDGMTRRVYLEYIRSFIGAKIIIYNYTSQQYAINHSSTVSPEGGSVTYIPSNNFCQFECELGTTSGGREVIIWNATTSGKVTEY